MCVFVSMCVIASSCVRTHRTARPGAPRLNAGAVRVWDLGRPRHADSSIRVKQHLFNRLAGTRSRSPAVLTAAGRLHCGER